MKIQVLNETTKIETRVALTPSEIKRVLNKFPDVEIHVEKNAGAKANFTDEDYINNGAKIGKIKNADITLRITLPSSHKPYQSHSLVAGFADPAGNRKVLEKMASNKVNVLAMEWVPRISRAQNVDALSSQANIAGYRAVLEASSHFQRYFPVMMTAAGSSKPAKVVILGVGVAGLQAIATAKRLGAQVEAFDIRPEVADQVKSLGAKFLEFDLGKTSEGEGGYAKELSEEAKKRQQNALQEHLKTVDIVITTAQIPGRPAPVLVTEEAVKGMATGSIILDMAAASGGNCPLTEADKVTIKHGVTLIGHTNYPAMVAADASQFYARNLSNLLNLLLVTDEAGKTTLNLETEDEIIQKSLIVLNGEIK